MNLKAALLATATAGAFLLVAACGGDAGGSDTSQSQIANDSGGAGGSGTGSAGSSGSAGGSGNAGGSGSVGGGSGSGAPAQYVAIDLNSSPYLGTVGWAVADGEQVGEGVLDDYRSPCSRYVQHALLWRGSPSNIVDLHPEGFCVSVALATNGGIQVGYGYLTSARAPNPRVAARRALKWAGSASSVVDLDPTGFWEQSQALGVSGDQIVGMGQKTEGTGQPSHALLWTSGGLVDLHPSRFTMSQALATDGSQQVGFGGPIGGNSSNYHALLWTGSADSVVDLHPASGPYGYCTSRAYGVSGGQQVGYGGACGYNTGRALLWTGSAESVVDLHPSGFYQSIALAVAAGRQVGFATAAGGQTHALVWSGTADSVVDLHVFLPASFRSSEARGIDASGNIIGTADGYAILWVRQ
jgi:hypothetical protein